MPAHRRYTRPSIRSDRAIAVGLEHLQRHLGLDWSPHPTDEEVQREYGLIWSHLDGRAVEALIDLPLMADPALRATLDVLTKLVGAVWHTNANLACMAICRAVNLSLEGGNCDSFMLPLCLSGLPCRPALRRLRAQAIQFGRLGYELVEKRELKRFRARVYKDFGAHVVPWTRHVRTSRDIVRNALDIAEPRAAI